MASTPPERLRPRIPEGIRFLIAGGFAAFITWTLRFPLSLIMPFAAAVTVANLVGMVIGFISYRQMVFPGSTRPVSRQVRDFIIVNLVSLVVVVAVAVMFEDWVFPYFGFRWHSEAIAHAIGIGVGAVSNYFGHKHFSFASR